MGKAALSFAILRKIVLEIPALYLLNSLFPLYGLSYAQLVAELVLSIASVIMLARIFRRDAEGGRSFKGRCGRRKRLPGIRFHCEYILLFELI